MIFYCPIITAGGWTEAEEEAFHEESDDDGRPFFVFSWHELLGKSQTITLKWRIGGGRGYVSNNHL